MAGERGVYYVEYRESRQRGSTCNFGFVLRSMKPFFLLLFREIPWEGSNRSSRGSMANSCISSYIDAIPSPDLRITSSDLFASGE